MRNLDLMPAEEAAWAGRPAARRIELKIARKKIPQQLAWGG
jgi:hypothetical protein